MSGDIVQTLLGCAGSGDLKGFGNALSSIPVHQLNTIGKEFGFQQAVALLVPLVREGSDARRLTALALIGRADSTTQQKQPTVAEAARAALNKEPPEIGAAGLKALTPDDRYYLALTLGHSDAAWVPAYAAKMLVDEDGQPRIKNDVRKILADIVFGRAETLSAAFTTVAKAVPGSQHEDPGTKGAELSRAKRLVKLLPAIEDAARLATADNGDDLAESFNEMMQALIFRFGRPPVGAEGDEAAAEAVDAALMLLSSLLRTRFLISVETEAYKTVARIKYWHRTDGWPKAAFASRNRLSQTLLQAIGLRAKTGNPSQELLAVLIQLAGDRRRIEPQLERLADQPGVPEEVQDWLRAGGRKLEPKFVSSAGEEAGLRDVDSALAHATIRASQVQALVEADAKPALGRIRERDELAVAARTLTQCLNFSRALANDVVALSRRRSLSLFGEPGEPVSTDPRKHKSSDGNLITTEMVKIDRPGVERVLPNGTAEVIVPAQVSEVKSRRK